MRTKFFATAICFVTATVVFCYTTGCIKEYSYEQKPVDTTTVVTPPITLPQSTSCAGCNYTNLPDSSWRFSIDGVTYCGKAGGSVIQFLGNGFSFSGPSACSSDSGFVATVKINDSTNALTTSRQNVKATLSCYYYDKIGHTNPFFSPMGEYQSLTVTDYDSRTHIAVGTFSGFVRVPNGDKKELKDGRFRIRL